MPITTIRFALTFIERRCLVACTRWLALNQPVWAMDFVHDQLALGKKSGILTVVDTHSRYCPAVGPWFAYCGEDVV